MQPNPNLGNVEPLSAEEVLRVVLVADPESRACVTCSFQAEDMIVLRMLKARLPEIPVLFLDTGYHFRETYQYRDRMAKEWALNLTNVLPKNTVEQQESLLGILNRTDPTRSEEHTSELQSQSNLVCRLLLEKKKHTYCTT